MKKKILTLALALSLLVALAIPASVAMAATSDTSTGTGTVAVIASTIDVTAPGNFAFGAFSIGANSPSVAPTNGSVTATEGNDGATGYTVTAKDQNTGTGTGCMLRISDEDPLNAELQINDGTIAMTGAGAGFSYTGGFGTDPLVFDAEQTIDGTDLAGDYDIIIEFAGSLVIP